MAKHSFETIQPKADPRVLLANVPDFKSGDDLGQFMDVNFEALEAYGASEGGITKEETLALALKFPELTSETLEKLGVHDLQATLDEKRTKNFRKEGYLEVSKQFVIVKDADEVMWLLKAAQYPYDLPETDADKYAWFFKTQKAQWSRLMNAQREVFAARLGSAINYPLAETKLVQFAGRTWTAHKLLEGAVEATEATAHGKLLTNKADLLTRPFFNALTNAIGDSAWQGLIADNRYYAHDIGIYYPPELRAISKKNLALELRESLEITPEKEAEAEQYGTEIYDYDRLPIYEPATKEACERFLMNLQTLDGPAAEKIFRGFIGSEKRKRFHVDQLLLRAEVLPEVYEKLKTAVGN